MATASRRTPHQYSLWNRILPVAQRKADWRQDTIKPFYQTYIQQTGRPVWSSRDYGKFADEGYQRNVVANRCIRMIAGGAAHIAWSLSSGAGSEKTEIPTHPLLRLLAKPNPAQSGAEFIEALISYRLISGNAYLLKIAPSNGVPRELHLLRPDRVAVLAAKDGASAGYEYTVGKKLYRYPVSAVNGRSDILHLKDFHPTDDHYGLSPLEAAAYSIDQHNQAAAWNQALLQNGAKPSGALVMKMQEDGTGGHLTDEQYGRIKAQVDEQFTGTRNAGRPMLLEGGMDWKEMSLSPKDMDFIEARHGAARDIALAFGVPPQLLGIPGDNTYSNLAEARLSLWEQTIVPLMEQLAANLNHWLASYFGQELTLGIDTEGISALAPRRATIWARIEAASFLNDDEKRRMLGIGAK